jgi:hypothetical protein
LNDPSLINLLKLDQTASARTAGCCIANFAVTSVKKSIINKDMKVIRRIEQREISEDVVVVSDN